MADLIPVVRFELDVAKFEALQRVLPEQAERGVRMTAALIEAEAARRAPEHTSNLINSISTEIHGKGYDTEAEIKATAPYAIFVHEGTGIFGPRQAPIRPVHAKALRFTTPDGLTFFRKSVKGMKGRPFLRQAFESEGPKLVQNIFS